MVLTLENKLEIVDYIGGVPKYQETFDEVYDHVISALSCSENSEFNIGLVREIVEVDLGGFNRITANETAFEKAFVQTCLGDMRQEIINAFRFPTLLFNVCLLVFCLVIYQFSKYYSFGIIHVLSLFSLAFVIHVIKYYFMRYVSSPTRKPSVKFKFIYAAMLIYGGVSVNLSIFILGKTPILELPVGFKSAIAFIAFFLFSNFFFAYYKVYKKRLRMLA
jgi:hypothetical protein